MNEQEIKAAAKKAAEQTAQIVQHVNRLTFRPTEILFISKEDEFIDDLHKLILLGYIHNDGEFLKLELSKLGRLNNLKKTKQQFEDAISIATANINDIERVKLFMNKDTEN